MADFQLRFHRSEIHELSDNYVYRSDALIKNEIGPAARRRGWFTRAEFIEVVHWKAPRVATRAAAANTAEAIEEVTRVALGARTEELRIWAPQALSWVAWPIACVLLHFAHEERYPEVDDLPHPAPATIGAT